VEGSLHCLATNLFNLCCRALLELLKRDIKPLDIMTPKAFENAITAVMALGGSTNAVLHLLAMSRAAGCPLDLADFQRISDKTPFIADLKPSGKYLMEDLHKVSFPDSCISFLKFFLNLFFEFLILFLVDLLCLSDLLFLFTVYAEG